MSKHWEILAFFFLVHIRQTFSFLWRLKGCSLPWVPFFIRLLTRRSRVFGHSYSTGKSARARSAHTGSRTSTNFHYGLRKPPKRPCFKGSNWSLTQRKNDFFFMFLKWGPIVGIFTLLGSKFFHNYVMSSKEVILWKNLNCGYLDKKKSLLKFIYSEKATKVCKISTLHLTVTT